MSREILIIAGPTGSGKTARAVAEALIRNGEIISVDSRQVYRGLNIGTEKITPEEMRGVPHHLLDIREPEETYSAGDFVADAERLIEEISNRGKLPILAGGTHFYYDALLNGLPENVPVNQKLRDELEGVPTEELLTRVHKTDARRALELDPKNRRRIIRALEIIEAKGEVPLRAPPSGARYQAEWILLEPDPALLKERLAEREGLKFSHGLIEEVRRVRERVGDTRLNELGLEYRIVGEYLRGERTEDSLLPALVAKLHQYARRQRSWLRKLRDETIAVAPSHPDKN